MDDLENTEKIIVAAPGANKVVIPTSCTLFVDRDASTAQSNSPDLHLGFNGSVTVSSGSFGIVKRFMRAEGGDRILRINTATTEISQTKTDGDNRNLTIKLSSAITSGSIDEMKVSVSYYIYDNS